MLVDMKLRLFTSSICMILRIKNSNSKMDLNLVFNLVLYLLIWPQHEVTERQTQIIYTSLKLGPLKQGIIWSFQ